MDKRRDDPGHQPRTTERSDHQQDEHSLGCLRYGLADGIADDLPFQPPQHADASRDKCRKKHGDLIGAI